MPFEFPSHVRGWLYPEEGEALQRLAIGKRVVEVGSYQGLSTIIMAKVAKVVVAVDPFNQCHVTKNRDTYPVFKENIHFHEVAHKVVPIQTVSGLACPLLRRCAFEVGFIDGEHSYEAVKADIAVVEPLVEAGGVIAFHDYDQHAFPGVKQAVDEWRKDRRFELISTLALVWL